MAARIKGAKGSADIGFDLEAQDLLRLGTPRAFLEAQRERYCEGKGVERAAALLSALRICLWSGEAVPTWAAQAFLDATSTWFALRARSLDEAFGVPPIGVKRFAQMGERRKIAAALFNAIADLTRCNKPIDWASLETKLGASKSKLQNLYYSLRGASARRNSQKRRAKIKKM